MKYTRITERDDGTRVWKFVPPQAARQAGVVRAQTFTDGRVARGSIPKLIEKVERFLEGTLAGKTLPESPTFRQLYIFYLSSHTFLSLRSSSQKSYDDALLTLMDTYRLGKVRVKSFRVKNSAELYSKMLEDMSVANANRHMTILSVLINFGISQGLYIQNPVTHTKKIKHEPKSEVWTKDQVEKFLEVAYEDFSSRNVGLIAQMCYEWAQRPVDISSLVWDSFNFDEKVVTITQSKRGATVRLPVEEPLLSMLLTQREDWGFQDYVVPCETPSGTFYKPYTKAQLARKARDIREKADLPDHLVLGTLRKTAINEFLESGVETPHLMSVTGHKNIKSLNPYVKHRLETATTAMSKRRKKDG